MFCNMYKLSKNKSKLRYYTCWRLWTFYSKTHRLCLYVNYYVSIGIRKRYGLSAMCFKRKRVFHGSLRIQDTRSRTYSGYFISGISERISRAHGSVLKRLRLFGEFRRFERIMIFNTYANVSRFYCRYI